MFTITTKYTTANNGAGRILAKGKGKQRTLPYDHETTVERNHGRAAGELALALGVEWTDDIAHERAAHQTHRFFIPS